MNHRPSNYFVVSSASNLIIEVVSTSYTPRNTSSVKFIPANAKSLDVYYRWLTRNSTVLMDIVDLASRCPYINDYVTNGKETRAKAQRISYRAEQPERIVDRETLIVEWIKSSPGADEHALHEVFNTGVIAARAYLSKHRQ